jgi:PAS domain S-box-containing protein
MPDQPVPSEAFWHAVMASIDVVLTVHDVEGRMTWGAEQLERVFDLPAGHVPGDGSGRRVHPDDLAALATAIVNGGRARYRLRHPDGRDRWVNATSTDCRADPEIRGFLVVHRDIDDEVRAEQTVAAMQRRERDILEVSTDGFVEWDDTGAFATANARFLELTGWGLAELRGRRWEDLLPAEGFPLEHLGNVAPPGARVGPLELQLRRRDGELIPVLIWGQQIAAAATDRLHWVSVFSDIRGYRNLAGELDEAKAETGAAIAQLERVIDAMDEGLHELDETGTVVFANRRLHEMIGCEPGSLVGRNALDLVHPDEAPRVAAIYASTPVVPGHRLVVRTRLHTTDGSTLWVQALSNAVEVDGGMRVVIVVSDITELEAARAAAVEADRTKSRFVARVAHELRNPLQPIIAVADLLADPDTTPEERAEYATLLRNAGTSMVRLVDELVDLERLSLGVMAVEHSSVAATELCRTIAAQYRLAAPDHPITVTGAECDACCDAGRLEQVLVGLIANALRYAHTSIEIDVQRTGDRVVIAVADHGPGIAAHLRERAFEPFDRLDRTDREGAGLGMAIAKRLIVAMDGTMQLTDTPGGGLTILLDLPAA